MDTDKGPINDSLKFFQFQDSSLPNDLELINGGLTTSPLPTGSHQLEKGKNIYPIAGSTRTTSSNLGYPILGPSSKKAISPKFHTRDTTYPYAQGTRRKRQGKEINHTTSLSPSKKKSLSRNGLDNSEETIVSAEGCGATSPNPMSCLVWNCSFFLIETKLHQNEWDWIKHRLQRPQGLFVDARGRKGGLTLLWTRDLEVSVLSYSTHHIEALVTFSNKDPWRFVGFYGNHEVGKRKMSWQLLRHVAGRQRQPTMYAGDFNEILHHSEQQSTRTRPHQQISNFLSAITDIGLIDLGFKGYSYTWSSNFLTPNTTRARLDRGLSNKHWLERFPNAEVRHLSVNRSDHLPLLIQLGKESTRNVSRKKSRFYFEDQWISFEGCKEVIEKAWNSTSDPSSGIRVFKRIQNTRLGLLQWRRERIGSVPAQIEAKQDLLDALNHGIVTTASKEETSNLSREIDSLRQADYKY